jgi:osmotically-inducible protein OsmY
VGNIIIVFLTAAILAAPALHGQSAVQPAPVKPAASVRSTPALANDAQLEKAIRDRFNKSKIRSENFTISVRQGVATLGGKTDVIQRKGTATRLARLAGAKVVNNNIEVSEAARERAANNLEKGRRRAQVKRSEVSGR